MIKSKFVKRVTVDDLTGDFAKVPLSRRSDCCRTVPLKGHGNEADFLGFLQKLVSHRSLTLPFEPFRFWLRIRDIGNRKTTPRLGESGSRFSITNISANSKSNSERLEM